MSPTIEILQRFVELMTSGWVLMVLLGAALAVLASRTRHRLGWLVLVPALLAGAYKIHQQAAVFDDAFVTFRYIDNWVRGLGPVFNPGEYVEGYSNPLWLLLVMVGHLVTSLEIPLVALILNVLSYLAVVGLAVYAGRTHGGHPTLPVAAALLAVQQSVTAYATTGMETLFGAALVLGAFTQMRTDRRRGWALAGVLLALAVVHRMDHALFWGAGLLAAVSTLRGSDRNEAVRRVGLYVLPVLLVVLHLGLKQWFYGDILPNTYYAKATDQWRVDQGWAYLLTFTMSSYLWLLLPLVGLWVAKGARESEPARVFVAVAAVLWPVYILKVGGDFMFSRFCLPIFPVLVVAAEAGVTTVAEPRRWLAWAALGGSLWGLPFIPERGLHHWGQADENSTYQLIGLSPVQVRHPSWNEGVFFRKVLYDRGITVHMGSCCIGMVGYYSRQPLMDFHGLTDEATAKQELRRRGLPGHEKRASKTDIRARGVKLARWEKKDPAQFQGVSRLKFPADSGVRPRAYSLVIWDQPTVDVLREKVPELRFRDFPKWLDRYIADMRKGRKKRKEVEEDMKWFRAYYFDHNDDRQRRKKILRWLREQKEKEAEKGKKERKQPDDEKKVAPTEKKAPKERKKP